MIHNVNFNKTDNIGDLNCLPVQYFDFLSEFKISHIIDGLCFNNENIIIGGGGLLYPKIDRHIYNLFNNRNKIVIWGIGINYYIDDIPSIDLFSKSDFIGIRDWNFGNYKYRWVPCVSCMSELFDKKYSIENDIVIYSHYENPIFSKDFPMLKNNCNSLKTVINFIGSSETVITNTYHGAYWATLLGRKVIIINNIPSTRFLFSKYKWNIKSFNDFNKSNLNSLIKNTPSYNESLCECRLENLKFYEKVMDYIS